MSKILADFKHDVLIHTKEVIVPGKRLGGHRQWKTENLNYLISEKLGYPSQQPITKEWQRQIPILDQGQLGMCTGCATTGLLGTEPFYSTALGETFDISEALSIYEKATTLDGLGSPYPPSDRGSTGQAALQAAQQMSYISNYYWGLTLQDMQLTLSYISPIIIGINWYTSYDELPANYVATIQPGSTIRGGHEIEVVGIDVENQLFKAANSWSDSWGQDGYFYIPWNDMQTQLNQGATIATATVPQVNTPTPAPSPEATSTPVGMSVNVQTEVIKGSS